MKNLLEKNKKTTKKKIEKLLKKGEKVVRKKIRKILQLIWRGKKEKTVNNNKNKVIPIINFINQLYLYEYKQY